MRVLHVISDENIGGAGVLLCNLLGEFDQTRVQSEVALPLGSALCPRLRELGIPMPELYEADRERERIVKEYLPGPTVYELVLQDRMDPGYPGQVEDMCRLLYPAGVNIDYFPTNFIPRDGVLMYIDYECSGYMEEWNFRNWGIRYWSKTPEFLEYAKNRGDLRLSAEGEEKD